MSNATINPTNIQLSAMRVTANGVDLGATEGGVSFTVKTDHAEIFADQMGKTPLDARVLSHIFGFKFVLAEELDPAKWKIAFPHAKQVGSNPYSIYFDSQIGDSLKAHATVWIFHPLTKADNDTSDDIKVWLAAAKSVADLKYGPDKQVGLAVELQVFPDFTSTPPRFLVHGDPTIGVVNAIAGSPAAGGGNTGNGTITAQAASNSLTVTETVTVAMVGTGSASAKIFTVTGSVSGLLGEFGLANAQNSTVNFAPTMPKPDGYVSFTITEGSTPFITGDQFTIAMTAANYA